MSGFDSKFSPWKDQVLLTWQAPFQQALSLG